MTKKYHRDLVEEALDSGIEVDDRVLSDYPEFKDYFKIDNSVNGVIK